MITALKKHLTTNNGNSPRSTSSSGSLSAKHTKVGDKDRPSENSNKRSTNGNRSPVPISAELQRKFAHGVNFNMKILIRGDRNSGKTSLWRRLQGLPFETETYIPTEEIQVANITWNYRTQDHIVKLDIWDVVDEGIRHYDKQQMSSASLKLGSHDSVCKNSSRSSSLSPVPPIINGTNLMELACDATTVNVYNNCDGVILVFDITRPWTWKYVQRMLPQIPSRIPVLIMANKIDLIDSSSMDHHDLMDCITFIKKFQRPPIESETIAALRFTQTSMKRAQGMKFLYAFFNIPFLYLQRNTLNRALKANIKELEVAQEELDLLDLPENMLNNKTESKGFELSGDDLEVNATHVQSNSFAEDAQFKISDERASETPPRIIMQQSSPTAEHCLSYVDDDLGESKMISNFEEDYIDDEQPILNEHKLSSLKSSIKSNDEALSSTNPLIYASPNPPSFVLETDFAEHQELTLPVFSAVSTKSFGSASSNFLTTLTHTRNEEIAIPQIPLYSDDEEDEGRNPLVTHFPDDDDDVEPSKGFTVEGVTNNLNDDKDILVYENDNEFLDETGSIPSYSFAEGSDCADSFSTTTGENFTRIVNKKMKKNVDEVKGVTKVVRNNQLLSLTRISASNESSIGLSQQKEKKMKNELVTEKQTGKKCKKKIHGIKKKLSANITGSNLLVEDGAIVNDFGNPSFGESRNANEYAPL